MRRRDQVSAIKAVVEVRRLQALAAEIAAARAAETLRMAEADRDEGAHQLCVDQENWARAMADSSLGLPVAALWRNQVVRSETALNAAEAEVSAAGQQRRARSDDWSTALARSEAAGHLAKTVFRSVKRVREEAALSELADRASRSVAR